VNDQPVSNRILAGAFTFIGLGVVWVVIVSNLPSQQELAAKESMQPLVQAAATHAAAEPVLDLSIPGVPASPPPFEIAPSAAPAESPSGPPARDTRAGQVARLRCEAEVERFCPGAADGQGRRECLEKRVEQLSFTCQHQVRERLVRWKEERNRLTLACEADSRRFCPDLRLGGGPALQCLQQHAQELSDRCYEKLPKGTLYFKQ
jgi:hypothetical protein